MDLNEILIFIKVVQSGSFSQAAKILSLPNSTVSYKVALLEKRLNVTLIHRTTRKLSITPAGEAYYRRCLQGMEQIQAAESELAAVQGEPQGFLRLTAPLDIGESTLPSILSRYLKKFPKVRVEVLLTDRRVDLLSESVDLAIRAGELKDSTLIAKKIGTTYFVPVASPKYLKEHGTPLQPKDLIKHKCLQFTYLGTDAWKFVGSKGTINVPLSNGTTINHLEMIRKMLLLDDGIGYLPTPFIYPDIKSRKLVRILPEWRSTLSPVHFVYPAQKFVSPKISSFIEFAGKELKESFSKFEI